MIFSKLFSNSFVRQSSIVFTGSMVSNVMAWLYHLFIGRILGPAQYGELAALFSLFYIINVPANVLQTVLIKLFSIIKAVGDYGQAKRLILYSTRLIVLGVVIGFVCVVIGVPYVAAYLHIQSPLNVIWLYLIFATFLLSIANGSALQGYQLFTASTFYGNLGMLLRLIFGVIFSFFGVGWTLISNIISNIITYILTFIPLSFLFSVPSQAIVIPKARAVKYSIPSFFTTLGLTALYSQDVLLVKHFFSSQDAGIYASISILGKVIFFASSAVSTVLFPLVSERKELQKSYRKIIWIGLGTIACICIVLTSIYFLFPHVISLFFGPTFNEAIPFLGSFAIFISFFSLSSILLSVLLALEKSAVGVFSMVAALSQFISIYAFHENIQSVITVNTFVAGGLFIVLLLYFLYEK